MKIFDWFAMVIAVIGGFISERLGGFDGILIALVTLIVLDYLTGVIKAICTKTLSSDVGFKGLAKKILILIIVAVSVVVQCLIPNVPIRAIVIMFYICNEGISILENAASILPIPEKLKSLLLQLRDKNKQEDNDNDNNAV